ncbi:MAG: hypothetical protein H0X34_08545 [Chthoniobacterales bacterium]|nr:hypothetical protein [Chthoniobacterales bacterium]
MLRANGVPARELAHVIDVVVVVADGDRQNLLRFVLLDDEAVEVGLDMARKKVEGEAVVVRLGGLFIAPASARSGWAKLANETSSPKFDFMNSESFACNSSGDGKGGF